MKILKTSLFLFLVSCAPEPKSIREKPTDVVSGSLFYYEQIKVGEYTCIGSKSYSGHAGGLFCEWTGGK